MELSLPSFTPHPLIRGGHLQTIWPKPASRTRKAEIQNAEIRSRPTESFEVEVSEGDRIVLHEDRPAKGTDGLGTAHRVLLIHGLTGCHAAPYMTTMAEQLLASGYVVYRMDMRGFGAAWGLSKNLSHAGRSDDVIAALQAIADRSGDDAKLFAVGVSLGGAQLLRGIGRVDAEIDSRPCWWSRLRGAVAISPPVDLVRCSQNMQRRSLRLYNRYFIRSLIKRAPKLVKQRDDFQRMLGAGRPKTLWELDDRITAPLSGFDGAEDYYTRSSSRPLLDQIKVPTLLIAAHDDPIVPLDCFSGVCDRYAEADKHWNAGCRLFDQPSGGHVGFVAGGRQRWLESVVASFIAGAGDGTS